MAEVKLTIEAVLSEEEIASGKLGEIISVVQRSSETVEKLTATKSKKETKPAKTEKVVENKKETVEETEDTEVVEYDFSELDKIFRSAVKVDKAQVSGILKSFGVKGLGALKESITNGDTDMAEVVEKLEEVA